MVMVYVQDCKKNELTPCKPVVARLLLKQGKAKVIRKDPFTIQLSYIPDTLQLQELDAEAERKSQKPSSDKEKSK